MKVVIDTSIELVCVCVCVGVKIFDIYLLSQEIAL